MKWLIVSTNNYRYFSWIKVVSLALRSELRTRSTEDTKLSPVYLGLGWRIIDVVILALMPCVNLKQAGWILVRLSCWCQFLCWDIFLKNRYCLENVFQFYYYQSLSVGMRYLYWHQARSCRGKKYVCRKSKSHSILISERVGGHRLLDCCWVVKHAYCIYN